MRYRQDVRRTADLREVIEHVRLHLAGAVDDNDDPSPRQGDVTVEILDHLDGDVNLVSVVGEIDGDLSATYLRSDFIPAAHYSDIEFVPFEQPQLGRVSDRQALARFRGEGRHERRVH